MASMNSGGGLKLGTIIMKQFEKKYFASYSEAEIWKANTTEEHEDIIRKESTEKYYIFVRTNSQEKQGL